MQISEQELRSMIRDTIARQRGAQPPPATPGTTMNVERRAHASHVMLSVEPVGDGECIIEPSVRCDHCGYCRSLGH